MVSFGCSVCIFRIREKSECQVVLKATLSALVLVKSQGDLEYSLVIVFVQAMFLD